jgi:aconitate decarboxylase
MSVEPRTYARVLADYVVANRGVAPPADLIARVRLLTVDTVGCGILGATLPWTRTVARTLRATQASGPSLVWGTGDRLSAADAALVNGSSVHACELDDVGAGGHHGSTTVTVALALAEAGHRLTGLDAVRAVVAGIEVAARVSECLGHEPQVRCGFHQPALVGTFAAAVTAASVLALDSAQCAHAISLAAQLASGLMGTQHGGMGKRLAAGNAAQAGMRAAQLAAHGFTGSSNIFECGYGSFPEAFCGGRPTYDLTKLDAGLGVEYRSYGINLKLWACRVPIHASLEAVTLLKGAHRFDADEIVSIRVGLSEAAVKAVGFRYTPATAASAQLNLRYCVAVLILKGDVFLDQFSDDTLAEPDVLALVARIDVAHDPTLDESGGGLLAGTIVQIILRTGQTLSAKGQVRGPDYLPITAAEAEAKFRKATRAALSTDRQQEVIEACNRFDQMDDVAQICRLLAAEDAAPQDWNED